MTADSPSAEQWCRIQILFESMLCSDQPLALLESEPDAVVRTAAERLFRDNGIAAKKGFLEAPITLIRSLVEPAPPMFAAGQTLAGRFTVERQLGSGGMGEVYLARDGRLQESVALKTIRSDLARDASIRRRFIAEIQNARRVTHRNVCRIFDLFEEGEVLFFTMQYLDGIRLSDWSDAAAHPSVRKRIAIELCEGLNAAHATGILHCDFKPSNVILSGDPTSATPVITDFGLAKAITGSAPGNAHSLQAGTLEYMAPELRAGSPATVQSDIYALGKVVLTLVPSSRIARHCVADAPADRPATIGPILRALRGGATRRLWLLGAGLAGLGGWTGYEMLSRPRLAMGTRERLLLNWFLPEGSEGALLLRNLLVTALRQSLLVTVVADDWVRSALGKLNFPARLPAGHSELMIAADREGIAFVMEGAMQKSTGGDRFLLQVFRPGEAHAVLAIAEPAGNQTMTAAERIARKLRQEFGESQAALRSTYVPLQRLVSASAQAAAFYYRGVSLYESAEAEAAIDWFDQALAIDPQFALAHLSRGIALAARYQWLSAISACKQAYDLRSRVSERERLWIEACYANIICDFEASLAACRRLVALYPDEAVFQRHTAFAYAANGRPEDALSYNRRALDLDPSGVSNASEWIVNHAEANQFDQALAIYDQLRQAGNSSTLLDWGAGLAWLGKGEFDQARRAFEAMGSDAKRDRWARLWRCAPGILQARFSEAASSLESDLAWDVAMKEQSHLVERRIWLGHLELLMDSPFLARSQAVELMALGVSPALLEANRQAALLAAAANDVALARTALDQLREIENQWPCTHTRGVRLHIEAVLSEEPQRSDWFTQAVGLWPDPPLLLSRAQWLRRNREPGVALADCQAIERRTGRVLKRYFPGLLVLAWIEEARCLTALSRFPEALRVYERIRRYWPGGIWQFRILRETAEEFEQLSKR